MYLFVDPFITFPLMSISCNSFCFSSFSPCFFKPHNDTEGGGVVGVVVGGGRCSKISFGGKPFVVSMFLLPYLCFPTCRCYLSNIMPHRIYYA